MEEISPEPPDGDSGTTRSTEPEVIETEVETHETEEGDLIGAARSKLKGIVEGVTDYAPSEPPGPRQGRKLSRRQQREAGDLADLVSTVLILVIALWEAPVTVKPNETEVGSFSAHLSNIVLRHIDLSMSQDVLDLAGMVAVVGSYMIRVGPDLRTWNETRKRQMPQRSPGAVVPGRVDRAEENNDAARDLTPIESRPGSTADFLRKVQSEPGE